MMTELSFCGELFL